MSPPVVTRAAEKQQRRLMPNLLTTEEVAARCRVEPATVRWWRHKGRGPKYTRLPGGRRVLYDEADVIAWMESGDSVDAAAATA